MRSNFADLHSDGSRSTAPRASDYVNPDPDGDGIAYNGKPVFTVDQAINQLNPDGAKWTVKPNGQITYTFLDKPPSGQYNTKGGEAWGELGSYTEGFAPFTAEQRDATRDAIQLWDDLISPTFVEKNGRGAADISYMNTSTGPAQAAAVVPNEDIYEPKFKKVLGDTFVNQDQPDNFDLAPGGYGFTTLVHETGHAIGLSHPGDYNFSDDDDGDGEPDPITYEGDAFYFQDSAQYTIMSYFNAENTGALSTNWATGYYHSAQTPMLHDIAAVQAMYGADLTTRTGDTTYGFNSTADRAVFDFTENINPFLTIYDAGGHDTLDFSGWTRDSILNLNDGEFSSGYGQVTPPASELNAYWSELLGGPINLPQSFWNNLFDNAFLSDNISIAYGTVIEDGVTGSGDDRLIGNEVANRLNGGAGDDVLTGNGGADLFVFAQTGGHDRITDFVSGTDKISLTGIDANSALAGDQAFSFIGANAFSNHAGELRTYVDGGARFLAGDVDGNGVADFTIDIGMSDLKPADLLL